MQCVYNTELQNSSFRERSKLGFFGSGVMAEAILRGLIAKDIVKPADVWASDL
jgi:hypothetical protein